MTRQAMSRGHDYQKLMGERCHPISAHGMGSLQGVTAQQLGAKHRRVNAAYKSQRLECSVQERGLLGLGEEGKTKEKGCPYSIRMLSNHWMLPPFPQISFQLVS